VPRIIPPVIARPVIAPPVIAPPVIAPPVIAPPVIARPVIAPPVIARPVIAPPVIAPPVAPSAPVAAGAAMLPVAAEPAPGAETAIFTKWLDDESSFSGPTIGSTAGFDRDESVPVHHPAPARRWPMVLAIEMLVVLAVLVGVILVALRRG
jgi:hypothetical protein